MNGRYMRVCAAGILLGATTACARPAGEIFPAVDPPLVWPLPPEQPRISYIGALGGSADLRPAKTGWRVLTEAMNRRENRPIRLTTPHAVAVGPDERVYVVDTGSASLHVIDLARRIHRRFEWAGDERLGSPAGVAVGPNGVFVTDAALGAVFEFGLDGTFKWRLDVQFDRPGGIAYCPDNGRLYVADTGAHRCVAMGRDGEVLFSFGERGQGPSEFNFPTHVVCHPLLGLLVSDTMNSRVQRFELDGTFVAGIGKKGDGAGDLSLPKGVAVDGDGNVYVVDAHFENVQIFRADGRLLLAFGAEGVGPAQFAIPGGVTVDHRDRVWVADSRNGRLQVFQYMRQAKP